MFFSREINLTGNGNFAEGDTILIRFRLYSDPYANGWGWAIDNLQIQQALDARQTALTDYDIKVFPNPFEGELKLSFDLGIKYTSLQLDVYDLYGKKVHSELKENVSGKWNEKVYLHHLSSGMYLIQISEDGKPIVSKKLIKN